MHNHWMKPSQKAHNQNEDVFVTSSFGSAKTLLKKSKETTIVRVKLLTKNFTELVETGLWSNKIFKDFIRGKASFV